MNNYLFIFFGSGFGGICRYFISNSIAVFAHKNFPYGTLTVNVTGSFLMGFLFVILLEKLNFFSVELRAFLLIGFLGGYTTFSSFSIETLNLFEQGKWLLAFSNVGAHLFLCIAASLLGVMLGRLI